VVGGVNGGGAMNICFGNNNSVRSCLIRKITKSKFSHVWIEYQSFDWDGNLAVHANEHGVIIEPLENVENRYNLIVKFECKHTLMYGFDKCKDYLGKKYDFKSVISNLILLLLIDLFDLENVNPVIDNNKFSCSEFVMTIFKYSKIENFSEHIEIPELYTPENVYRICEEYDIFELIS
jgi:hypothetical protein